MDKTEYMFLAIEEARRGIRAGDGGPFGCVVVRESDGEVIGRGHNEVLLRRDPTCHGEVTAIRNACANIGSFNLSGCVLYTTAEPCPMCRGAIQWANIARVYYGCNVSDTEKIGFRDKVFYEGGGYTAEELSRPECLALFAEYNGMRERETY